MFSPLVCFSRPTGRPDLPLPLPSRVTTRKWRERNGIWPLKIRECVIGEGGMNTIVGPSFS